MKYFILVLFVLLLSTALFSQQFSRLNGLEDSQGNTILLYSLGVGNSGRFSPVFKYEVNSGIETKIMDAYSNVIDTSYTNSKTIDDYEFFPNNITNFINVGFIFDTVTVGYAARNDTILFNAPIIFSVDISKQNPLKVFLLGSGGPIRSWDGGYSYPIDSIPAVTNFRPIALSNFDDEIMFGINEDNKFSRNGIVVDTSLFVQSQYFKMLYDINQFHIYRINWTYGGYALNVSNNKGSTNTWTKTYQSENPIYITIDSTQSGVIYLADGKEIYKSINNSYNFYPYKALPRKVVGLYKKPNSEILYAASKYQLYEVRVDTITVIKSLPLPEYLFDYYPLKTGNFWKYKIEIWDSWPEISYSEDTFSRRVISAETKSNNKEYFKIEEKYYNSLYTTYVYERVDTATGKIFRFDNECTSPDSEKIIDDLTAELVDSLLIQRFTQCWDSILTYFSLEESLNIFGVLRQTRQFDYNSLVGYSYKLAKGIGIESIRNGYDFGNTTFLLKGCVINGVLYGDTTITDVEKSTDIIPNEYKLQQNYPNPFNPSTTITYQLLKAGKVTLKVFNVLGREVETLVDEYQEAGDHSKLYIVNSTLPSGVYFYKIRSGNFVEVKKMILLK